MERLSPAAIEALLDQAAELKSALVEYATSPGFKKRLAARYDDVLKTGLGRENSLYEAIESILYDRGPGAEPLIERYLRTNKTLGQADRAIYESWRDRGVFGVFKVIEHAADRILLRNLIDELDYETYSSQGADSISGLKPGGFVMTRIVPIGHLYTLSGTTKNFGPQDAATANSLAARLLSLDHSLPFHNPQKLAAALANVAQNHRIFGELFGSHALQGTGAQMIEAYRTFLEASRREAAARNGMPGDLARTGPELAPDDSFPAGFAALQDVRLVHHPVKSVVFLVDYDRLEAAHRTPPTRAQDPGATVLRGYLEDDQIPFFILQALAEQHPETVDALYRVALERPDFTWEADGEALLRTYKPAPIHHEDLPRIAMVPVSLSEAYQNLT